MKKAIVFSALAFLGIACSTTQKTAESTASAAATQERTITSYGPGGKIIKKTIKPEVQNTETKQTAATSGNKVKPSTKVSSAENNEKPQTTKTNDGITTVNAKETSTDKKTWKKEIQKKSVVYKTLKKINKKTSAYGGGDSSKNWASIAGFTISLVGLFIFGLILGIIAVIFGAIGLKSNKRGLAIAAIIIGIVDIIGAFIFAAMMA